MLETPIPKFWNFVGTPARGATEAWVQPGSTSSVKDRVRAERPDAGDDNCAPNSPVVGWCTDTTVYSHQKYIVIREGITFSFSSGYRRTGMCPPYGLKLSWILLIAG